MSRTACIFILISLPLIGWTQSPGKTRSWELKGYLNDLQMVQFQKINDPWILDNELQNRLDFFWHPGKVFRLGLGMRNRFLFGQSFAQNPAYKGSLTTDPGLVNLTWSIFSGESFLLVSQFDRAWFSLTAGKVQLTVGRQRINWGQAIVWNPNDIFNTYSFYDFDYPERPGSDAIRLQFYPGYTSVLEAAIKWNNQGKITVAGLCRFNLKQYDIQFLGGLVDDRDYVIGAGWSGNISQAAFRGEISYFYPKNASRDTSGLLLATMGIDYSFSNSLYLVFQIFYNQLPPDFQPENFISLYQAPPSPKILSFAEWNIFLQGSYPVTPLFDVNLAAMYYPDLNGFFIGPTINYSVRQNLDLSVFAQYFNGRFTHTGPQHDQSLKFRACIAALRLKWNF
ncbi:MAG: hypothetical protein D4R67_05070 [Bacteroidetes bacterium]|nr:MAG: hypothetical protein D4R67_05070 [Bacteroidota bacterium]